tara:strand:+ start:79 stop:291 length:213 start_codon:yes stop_codon:yes gene_type:complete
MLNDKTYLVVWTEKIKDWYTGTEEIKQFYNYYDNKEIAKFNYERLLKFDEVLEVYKCSVDKFIDLKNEVA